MLVSGQFGETEALEDVKAMLEKDEKFVIRLYSTGDIENLLT